MTLLKREIVGPNPVLDSLNSMLTFPFFFSHFFSPELCLCFSLTNLHREDKRHQLGSFKVFTLM